MALGEGIYTYFENVITVDGGVEYSSSEKYYVYLTQEGIVREVSPSH
jgi:hypothetical protein